jgi:DNA (cytosine-5)-methyltransferase 1
MWPGPRKGNRQVMRQQPSAIRILSLFCGPGGFDEGFRQAGFTTGLAFDSDAISVKTHQRNHPEAHALVADLTRLRAGKIIKTWTERYSEAPVGVIGGPPCQSFSKGNSRPNGDDPRHDLPGHYARLLRGLNRRFALDFFVFENVPGLSWDRNGDRLEQFKSLFRRAGFEIHQDTLDAQYFGVAQSRPRIFVVGINKDKYPGLDFKFPAGSSSAPATVESTISALPEALHYRKGLQPEEIPFHPNHWCMAPKSAKFKRGRLKPGKYIGRSFRVLVWNQPSYTVAYGHREVHVHPTGRRRLSVFEAMLLQGFTHDYVLLGTLSDQIRQVSEAVSPPVARALAESIRKQLGLDLNEDETGLPAENRLPNAKAPRAL